MTERNVKEEMEELARYVKLLQERARVLGVPAIDAEDIAQNAFIDACNREKALPSCPEERKALLFAIVKFQVMTYLNERRRMGDRASAANAYMAAAGIVFADDHEKHIEAKELIELVFPRIPPEQLEILTSRVLDNLTVREIALHFGIKENTAQSRLDRAIARFRVEVARLEKRRRVRSTLFTVGILGMLTTARNAQAMVSWIRKMFQLLMRRGTVPLRALPGLATAAAVLVSPGHPRASADELMLEPRELPIVVATSDSKPSTSSASVDLPEVVPVKRLPSAKVELPQKTAKTKPREKMAASAAPPDHLLSTALLALQQGNPEKALTILNGYVVRDAGDASAVEAVREVARNAIAEKAERR